MPSRKSDIAEILAEIKEPKAADFEKYALCEGGMPVPCNGTDPPLWSIQPSNQFGIDPLLYSLATSFLDYVAEKLSIDLTIGSGCRPPEYQTHFQNLRNKHIALTRALDAAVGDGNWAVVDDCQKRIDALIDHADRHKIRKDPVYPHYYIVARASDHALNPAQALDISGIDQLTKLLGISGVRSLAGNFKLLQPLPKKDPVHFRVSEKACQAPCEVPLTLIAYGLSPVAILVTDSLGRRVGFDPITQNSINEIGSNAQYFGSGEPQVIVIWVIITSAAV